MRTHHRAFAGTVLALLAACPAYATDEDTQLWAVLNTTVPLAEHLHGSFEISPRAREGADQLLTRASVELRLADGLTIGTGLGFVEFEGGTELRPHQQITYTTGPLALRTRLEERFFQGSARAQLRLRQQARVSFPLGDRTQISGMGEVLYIAQSEVPGGDARVDQWRAEIGVRHRLNAHFETSLAYRAILSPRGPAEDRLSHVPLISLSWRP